MVELESKSIFVANGAFLTVLEPNKNKFLKCHKMTKWKKNDFLKVCCAFPTRIFLYMSHSESYRKFSVKNRRKKFFSGRLWVGFCMPPCYFLGVNFYDGFL